MVMSSIIHIDQVMTISHYSSTTLTEPDFHRYNTSHSWSHGLYHWGSDLHWQTAPQSTGKVINQPQVS